MDIRKLTPRYYVAPQIDPGEVADLKAHGITRILCNRPDAEVPASHSAAAIEAAATEAGLKFELQPLTHQTMTPDIIARNRELGADTDDVVLAYCASGTRSTIAWALGQAGRQSAEAILTAAREAGYNLEQLRPHLEAAES